MLYCYEQHSTYNLETASVLSRFLVAYTLLSFPFSVFHTLFYLNSKPILVSFYVSFIFYIIPLLCVDSKIWLSA